MSTEDIKYWVTEWVDIDNTERDAKKSLKKLKEKKKALTDKILKYMSSNKMGTINITDGLLLFDVKERVLPVNKEYLTDKMSDLMNPEQAEEFIHNIYDKEQRPKKEIIDLKRK